MEHPILGTIRRPDGDVFDGVATVRLGRLDVTIQMIRDDQPFEATLGLAAEVARRLPEIDAAARRVAVADLRGLDNAGWTEYDEAQEDGSWRAVSNPELSESEFAARLTLDGVNVTGNRSVEFFYEDGGMF